MAKGLGVPSLLIGPWFAPQKNLKPDNWGSQVQKWIQHPQNRGDTMSVHVLDWDRYLVPGTRFYRELTGPDRGARRADALPETVERGTREGRGGYPAVYPGPRSIWTMLTKRYSLSIQRSRVEVVLASVGDDARLPDTHPSPL